MFNVSFRIDTSQSGKIGQTASVGQNQAVEEEQAQTTEETTKEDDELAKELSGNGEKTVFNIDDINNSLSTLYAALNSSQGENNRMEIFNAIRQKQTERKEELINAELNTYLDKNGLSADLKHKFSDLETVSLYTSAQTQKDVIKAEIKKTAEQLGLTEDTASTIDIEY